MKNITIVSVFFMLLITGCADNDQSTNGTQPETALNGQGNDLQEEQKDSSDEPEIIAEGLEIPWSIDKAEDTFYLTERPGHITRIENGETHRQEVELEENLSTVPEAGLLGFVLDPEFMETDRAYAYYTYESSSGPLNRIVTLHLSDDVWREDRVLLDGIPSGTYHHGGRLKIGPDGMLYATTGDASVPDIAQDLDSLGGKILRMNLDGSVPGDNPFTDSYVYSYGHRNPQGLAWSSEDTLYSSEHGSRANDEVNLIEAGENYGWPIIEGVEEQEGMVSPLFTSGDTETWAPSGMDYYNRNLYVSGLRGSAVYIFDLETGEYRELISGFGRIRDVLIEDDYLYFISNNTDGRGSPEENDDKLYRILLPM